MLLNEEDAGSRNFESLDKLDEIESLECLENSETRDNLSILENKQPLRFRCFADQLLGVRDKHLFTFHVGSFNIIIRKFWNWKPEAPK